jgi:hypothetical protein
MLRENRRYYYRRFSFSLFPAYSAF